MQLKQRGVMPPYPKQYGNILRKAAKPNQSSNSPHRPNKVGSRDMVRARSWVAQPIQQSKSIHSPTSLRNHNLFKDAIIQVPYGSTKKMVLNDIKTLNSVHLGLPENILEDNDDEDELSLRVQRFRPSSRDL